MTRADRIAEEVERRVDAMRWSDAAKYCRAFAEENESAFWEFVREREAEEVEEKAA